MFAFIQVGNHQYKVKENQKVYLNRIAGEDGAEINFDKVLLLGNSETVKVGKPYVENASVTGKVLKQLKADKVMVFKKKKRKGFRKLRGHRQTITQVEILKINS